MHSNLNSDRERLVPPTDAACTVLVTGDQGAFHNRHEIVVGVAKEPGVYVWCANCIRQVGAIETITFRIWLAKWTIKQRGMVCHDYIFFGASIDSFRNSVESGFEKGVVALHGHGNIRAHL